jgi:hypothetical protein
VCGAARLLWCCVSVTLAAGRVRPPFIDQGGSESHARRAIKLREGGVACYAVEWAAVRTILAAIWPSWPILYPNSGGSRVEVWRRVMMSSDGLEGAADVGLYGVQE